MRQKKLNTAVNFDLNAIMEIPEKIQWLSEKLALLEEELRKQTSKKTGWLSINDAAVTLGKSSSAIRQRIRHKERPMPENIVWRQAAKGHAIAINVDNYRKYM